MLQVFENRYDTLVQPRHAHAETTITIVLAGALRERVGAREEIGRALSIVVKPRDTEHANEFGSGVRTLQICLSEAASVELEQWSRDVRSWGWRHGGPSVKRFIALLAAVRAPRCRASYRDDVEQAAYDALAALRVAESAAVGIPPGWLARVREAIDDSPRGPTVCALAAMADVHPVYLARQFRRWFGCSITEHVRRRRVQRAAATIASGTASLSTISYQQGFADQPHMSRAFAREMGVTPAAYRAFVVPKV